MIWSYPTLAVFYLYWTSCSQTFINTDSVQRMLPPTEGIQLKSHWSLGRHQSLPSFPHLLLSNRRKVYFTLFFLCFSCCFIENWCCDSVRNRPQSGFYFLFAFNSWASHRCSCSVAADPQTASKCHSEELWMYFWAFAHPISIIHISSAYTWIWTQSLSQCCCWSLCVSCWVCWI